MIPDIDQKVAKFKTAKKIQNVWDTFVGKFVTKKLKISANLVTLLPIYMDYSKISPLVAAISKLVFLLCTTDLCSRISDPSS